MLLPSTPIPSRRGGCLGSTDCGMVLQVLLVSMIHSISAKWVLEFCQRIK